LSTALEPVRSHERLRNRLGLCRRRSRRTYAGMTDTLPDRGKVSRTRYRPHHAAPQSAGGQASRSASGRPGIRSIATSGGARLATLPITAAATLLTTGLTIRAAGAAGYGAISLVGSILLLLPFTDLGLGAAVTNAVASIRISDRRAVLSTIASGARVLCFSGIVVLALAISGRVFFSWSQVLGTSEYPATQMDTAVAAALAIFALTVPLGIGARILLGAARNHIAVAMSTATSVVACAYTLVVVTLHANPVYLVLAFPLGAFATALGSFSLGVREIQFDPMLVFHRKSYRARGLMHQAIPSFGIMLGTTVALQSDRIILSHRASAQQLAKYALGMQFYAPIWSVVVAAGLAMWPVFSANREDRQSGARTFRRCMTLFGGLALVLGCCLALAGAWAADIVSGGRLELSFFLLVCFGAVLFFQTCQLVPGMFLTDLAGLRWQALCVGVMAVLNVSLSWWLAGALGAPGPLIGTAISVCLAQLLPGLVLVRRRLSTSGIAVLPPSGRPSAAEEYV
jgi:O-antigen/teichoic acid export membrane protein